MTELLDLAAFLANTTPEKILAAREIDGALAVVVSPGPKFTFLPDEVSHARAMLEQMKSKIETVATEPQPLTPVSQPPSHAKHPRPTRSPHKRAALRRRE